jgi:phage terminase Nu1 subunit (DNA packaging protein)
VAIDVAEAELSAMIGVPLEQLAALERDGMPVIGKAKGKRYPLPGAIKWFVEYSIARRVGGVPPRVNQQDLAGLLGVVPRQVKNLVDTGKISSVVEGGKRLHELPKVVHEFVKYQKELAGAGKKDALDPLDAAKLRKMTAEADAAEMELLHKRGELLDRVTAERAMGELVQAMRSEVQQVPARHDRNVIGLKDAAHGRKALKSVSNELLVRMGAVVAAVGRRIQLVAEDLQTDGDDEPKEDAANG